eukprot:2519089-Alexandrium_andersonii.AAC.1
MRDVPGCFCERACVTNLRSRFARLRLLVHLNAGLEAVVARFPTPSARLPVELAEKTRRPKG